jgi:L-ascorbate metabolism protein UlaG (beta-lactamase superfamily)
MSGQQRPVATATHLGTATVLLQLGALALLTDPALDPVTVPQAFAVPGTDLVLPLRRSREAVLPSGGLPGLDAVLLSHDQHADNFDGAGRCVAAAAGVVVTTLSGARRLGGNAVGLACWESLSLERDGTTVTITATPARHGPPGSEELVGDVIGFVVEVVGLPRALYVSGDTVVLPELDEIGRRFSLGPALLHLGRARFSATGETAYSMSAAEAAALSGRLQAAALLPVHVDDWEHFSEPAEEVSAALAGAPCPVHELVPGQPLDLWRSGALAAS